MQKKQQHIVVGVTGSIAAYKSPDIIRQLQQCGFCVSVIMTTAACRFITPLTIASITRGNVYRDMFGYKDHAWKADHISLAESAAAVLVAPATADFIGKAANGIADDLLTCTVMATRAKVLVAPAMNEGMYRNPFVQDNIAKLKKYGVRFIGPGKGPLACGSEGEGRLIDTDKIVQEIQSLLK